MGYAVSGAVSCASPGERQKWKTISAACARIGQSRDCKAFWIGGRRSWWRLGSRRSKRLPNVYYRHTVRKKLAASDRLLQNGVRRDRVVPRRGRRRRSVVGDRRRVLGR